MQSGNNEPVKQNCLSGDGCRNGHGDRGFSLVEILVVITIMALLVGLVSNAAINFLDKGEVTTCQSQLKQIATNLELYKQRKKRWPQLKGIQFLLVLTKGGQHAMVQGRDTKIFLCPGTDDDNRAPGSGEWGSAYEDHDNLDSLTISYAGRNVVDFKIRYDSDVLAADDNEGRKNHKYATNFVTKDSSVDSVDIEEFLDEYPEMEWLPVGPDSPYEPFQCLQWD
jgi:prepilin-type N-terminal cleavage/methylation domain-containing protein